MCRGAQLGRTGSDGDLRRAHIAGAAILLLGGVTAACGSGDASGPSPDVPLPSPHASPQDVVSTYVAALDAHDRHAIAVLTDDDGTAARWAKDIKTIKDLKITSVLDEDPTTAGLPAGTQLRDVGVTFRVTWNNDDDPSVGSGEMAWGYLLKPNPKTGWVIVDQGTG